MLNDKSILITGGTGSFGRRFVEIVLSRYRPKRLVILSRDELKQHEMQQTLSPEKHPCLRYFIGDIRDPGRLQRAFRKIDVVVHAAALKQVPACEYNPYEAIKTNILGGQNIVETAIDEGVSHVLALSTDKAANPINLYGATKLCSDKLFINGNSYSGPGGSKFSVVRYGNVLGSRGSVVPRFIKAREEGVVHITDPSMTRFWITLDRAVDFVLQCIEVMHGGEIFIPKLPSMTVGDMADALCPGCRRVITGVRPGEKIHEVMIPLNEARNAYEFDNYYVIKPAYRFFERTSEFFAGTKVPENFEYSSETNTAWLTREELLRLVEGS
ncbi:UDP-N-acetylglucosamine 4,6-dehydratase (inverting) [Solidesulfovibrio carbinolicus]|uniref:UDP-N-acetylglucosamine 4,6-dehydratase (Inverting) n=1 Tax=Solidesulfovibrio carbinolicus TaxID=296842 RepID=A0A4P6HQN5_9BACT|nr:UDP-N-acetylglucosamine 4,6-dehydratase (inverting) [Solidesulfovibrio carbinolicus]QAZ69633.1 UDP-N-acetylglucosamine 4,6-dehydratase (inverting) [Solidesulfovibrio carbinolicus]